MVSYAQFNAYNVNVSCILYGYTITRSIYYNINYVVVYNNNHSDHVQCTLYIVHYTMYIVHCTIG